MFVTFSGHEGNRKVTQKVTRESAGRPAKNLECYLVTSILAPTFFRDRAIGISATCRLRETKNQYLCSFPGNKVTTSQFWPHMLGKKMLLFLLPFCYLGSQKSYRGDVA